MPLTQFAVDVRTGLSRYPRAISSKYFYDERGDYFFEQIMEMPEYYLTRAEFWIFNHLPIVDSLRDGNKQLDVYELGAGNGYKTRVLLQKMIDQGIHVHYYPIDISQNALDICKKNILAHIPALNVTSIQGDYFDTLKNLEIRPGRSRLIMFLGSNLGNFLPQEAQSFVQELSLTMTESDQLLIGLDLKKDPDVILRAYNDSTGITASFNLNLLKRINQELDADFDLSAWKHSPVYDPGTGTTKSYLMSLCDQQVKIKALDQTFQFKKWETIHTEISQKYDRKMVEELAKSADLIIQKEFLDNRSYYADYLFTKNTQI